MPFLQDCSLFACAITLILGVSLFLLFYAWIGYPVLLALAARVRGPRKAVSPDADKVHAPRSVAILIAAYNEEAVIRDRLTNAVESCAGLTAAGVSIQIHVGVDGSDDRTAEIASGFAETHSFVHVHDFQVRRGKVAVLKDLVSATGEGEGKDKERGTGSAERGIEAGVISAFRVSRSAF